MPLRHRLTWPHRRRTHPQVIRLRACVNPALFVARQTDLLESSPALLSPPPAYDRPLILPFTDGPLLGPLHRHVRHPPLPDHPDLVARPQDNDVVWRGRTPPLAGDGRSMTSVSTSTLTPANATAHTVWRVLTAAARASPTTPSGGEGVAATKRLPASRTLGPRRGWRIGRC